jgi:hypothetical protein
MILLRLHGDRCATGAAHQHAAAGPNRFIVDIDADNGIGAQMKSLCCRSATTMSRLDAKKLRKRFEARITAFSPSILGVVERVICPR